jgi:hypothetical protein
MEAIGVKEELLSSKILESLKNISIPTEYVGPKLDFPISVETTDPTLISEKVRKFLFDEQKIPVRFIVVFYFGKLVFVDMFMRYCYKFEWYYWKNEIL